MTIVGFTGTRDGMTEPQYKAVHKLFTQHYRSFSKGMHGVCKGSDKDFDDLCKMFNVKRHGLPGKGKVPDPDLRADCDCEIMDEERPHLTRNKIIVDSCDFMIATPPTKEPQDRGGTWWTIKYAWKVNRAIWVIAPDGSMKLHHNVKL